MIRKKSGKKKPYGPPKKKGPGPIPLPKSPRKPGPNKKKPPKKPAPKYPRYPR